MAAHRMGAVLSEVLLSPDLAPHILAQLPTKEHAVKGTCRAWRRGWKETLARRERMWRLLVFGGVNNGGNNGGEEIVNSMERYDPAANGWEVEAVAPMPTARKFVGSAMLDGKLYHVGGDGVDHRSSSSVERYDLATKAWEAVAPLATARQGHGVGVLGGKLYAVGGQSVGVSLSSVERYDPAVDVWEAVAPMASERDNCGVAVLDGSLYAVGGYSNGGGGATSSVERYDPATNAWEALAPLTTARCIHAVAVLDGKLYAAGGYSEGADYLSSVERYDPAANAWVAVAPMASAWCSVSMAVLDGKLFAVGGEKEEVDEDEDDDAGCFRLVERYDPALDAWEAVAPMGTARCFHGIAVLEVD